MKRLVMAFVSILVMTWSLSSIAAGYAFVDMKKIFSEAPEIKNINKNLESKFDGRKNAIVKANETLQTDIKKLERDRAVMSAKDAQALTQKIEKEGGDLHQQQTDFQQALFAAQNEAMKGFMDKLSGVVAKIAKDKSYDFVLPKNDLVYSNDKLDITSQVLSQLK